MSNSRKAPAGRPAYGPLAVYVTSHGFGHMNRTVAALNRLPPDLPIEIRCSPDLFPNWRERLLRSADFLPHVSDAGAVNPAGGSASTDAAATLDRAVSVHREAVGRIDEEAASLQDRGVAAVLCDTPYFPLVAASRAGIPGFLLANFTWYDIYKPYTRKAGASERRFVAEVRTAYRHATGVFRAEPAMAMSWLASQISVGLVANPGRDRSRELRTKLGLGRSEKLSYFYVGRYGQHDLNWERLGSFARRGVHFVGYHESPVGELSNLHLVKAEEWSGGDLIASTDAVVAKAGYGTVAEAMAHGRPILYPPRAGFAEFRALDRALRSWGGGVPVSTRDFLEMRLEKALDRAFSLGRLKPPYPTDGASQVAGRLANACRLSQL